MVRTAPDEGAAIAVEVWDMPLDRYGSFVALIQRRWASAP